LLARFLEIEKSGQEPAPDGATQIHVVVPVHAPIKTLREALWFEVNPPLKDSAQRTQRLCDLRERLKIFLGSVVDYSNTTRTG
jgi:hypothetical protein